MKKTYKFLTTALLGALTLSSLGLANVQAQTTDTDASNATNASIKIVDGIIKHTLPSDDIVFPQQTFSFATYFGSEAYSTAAESGSSLALGVNDQRSLNGITNGWKVTAQLSSFTKNGEGKTLGEGTFISLLTGEITKSPFDGISAPTVNKDIKLPAGSEATTTIWFANRGSEEADAVGVDEWTLNYEASNIKLTIPNKELVEGSHSAIITWTFSPMISETNAE